jgi:hypothetical protein
MEHLHQDWEETERAESHAAFATEGPMPRSAASMTAAKCRSFSSGKERPPQDDNLVFSELVF